MRFRDPFETGSCLSLEECKSLSSCDIETPEIMSRPLFLFIFKAFRSHFPTAGHWFRFHISKLFECFEETKNLFGNVGFNNRALSPRLYDAGWPKQHMFRRNGSWYVNVVCCTVLLISGIPDIRYRIKSNYVGRFADGGGGVEYCSGGRIAVLNRAGRPGFRGEEKLLYGERISLNPLPEGVKGRSEGTPPDSASAPLRPRPRKSIKSSRVERRLVITFFFRKSSCFPLPAPPFPPPRPAPSPRRPSSTATRRFSFSKWLSPQYWFFEVLKIVCLGRETQPTFFIRRPREWSANRKLTPA